MALTSVMQHYLSVKEKYKDCIIFYRLGDFYEMFFDDAVKVSSMLDLTLTGKDCGLSERAPMCGVPYHAADGYIAKLVSMGEKVAICEQLDTYGDNKMLERQVVRVVTAGTFTDSELLDEKTNNFICCAYSDENAVALAWADITTGELFATEFKGAEGIKQSISQMINLSVKEVICNDDYLIKTKNMLEEERGILPVFSNYPSWAFVKTCAEKNLLNQLKTVSLSAFGLEGKDNAICAAGALLEYLKETQMHALKNIYGISYIAQDSYLVLDDSAIRNLELVKNLSGNKKYGSLLWVLDKTCTAMGARLLYNSILYPLCDKDKINYRLDGVEELFNASVIRMGLCDLLKSVKDIERLSGKISNGKILPKDCLTIASSLAAIPNIKFQLTGFSSQIIADIINDLYELKELKELLEKSIDPAPPVQMKDGGYIKEGYSKQLDELRSYKRNNSELVKQIEEREKDKTGIRTLKIEYNRVFGYYIEVSKSFKDKVPVTYRRKQTLANAERYTTDELKEIEEKILGSDEAAKKLEVQLFDFIKNVLGENINNLKTLSTAIAKLDMLVSFAEVAKTNKYCRPQIVESDEPLIIKDGRHPVVECISKERFVANDTLLDEGENRTIILTGPNMAGKSTYMRQNALMVIMASMGSFVPAKSASIPVVDRVYTRVGASDNLISDRSTFMVEMIEVATILQNATKNSLLILDEVGRGTSTYDGLSIAWAIIEHINDKIKAKTLFATHYHELTELENTLSGVKNYKISVKEINGQVVFMRKILRGGANRSFGIEVAALAGVPNEVTQRAKQILKEVERGDRKFEFVDEDEVEVEKQESEIERILKDTDINSISPMQAFMILSDLVEKVENEKD